MHRFLIAFCILDIAFCISGCSIPNLENRQCSEARDSVKEFYSWYLGTDAAQRDREPEVFARYVSPNFPGYSKDGGDPYFQSLTVPTTFKVGRCDALSETRAVIQVQLYWRDDKKVDQKEVYADVAKIGDKWLIEKVESR